MDDVNQTKQHVVTLSNALQKEVSRVARWTIACFIFAVAVSLLVAATKSVLFLVVALCAWFFAWNRWKLRRFLARFLPPPQENQGAWVESAVHGLHNSPPWYRFSEYIALATFIAIFLLITIEVVPNAGTWMRVLYGACWMLLVSKLVVGVRSRQKPKDGMSQQ